MILNEMGGRGGKKRNAKEWNVVKKGQGVVESDDRSCFEGRCHIKEQENYSILSVLIICKKNSADT